MAVTEPIVMEVIAAARPREREHDLRRLLRRFDLLRFHAAWRHGAALLAADGDIVRMAGAFGIKLDEASR